LLWHYTWAGTFLHIPKNAGSTLELQSAKTGSSMFKLIVLQQAHNKASHHGASGRMPNCLCEETGQCSMYHVPPHVLEACGLTLELSPYGRHSVPLQRSASAWADGNLFCVMREPVERLLSGY